MGFWDFFSGGGGHSERQLARAAKKLMNKHVQTQERKHCIDVLEQIGNDEAIHTLLMRFTFRTEVQIVDEDEKEAAYHAVLRLGERAIPAIAGFVHDETAIYWPLRALTEIAGQEMAVDVLLREIEGITENFDRDVARKHELVSNLREFQSPRVWDALVRLLKDEQEDVRILAVDGISAFDDPRAVDFLAPLLVSDEESTRVKQWVLDLFLQRKWNVKKYKKELSAKLPAHFWVDDTGAIQRK